MTRHLLPERAPRVLPKLCGADVELGNFIEGVDRAGGSGAEASRALLREIDGIRGDRRPSLPVFSSAGGGRYTTGRWGGNDARHASKHSASFNPQDWGRKFLLENGGCAYIDLNHLEICLPEVRSAYDHVACWHAMLRLVREAMGRANARQPAERRIHVFVNNSDGLGNSYGSHLNFLVSGRTMENVFARKCQLLLYLAAFQVSSISFTGQGKVGSENRAPRVDFQLSQRADFFERVSGLETTFARPIVNSRDEAHCGDLGRRYRSNGRDDGMARLHVIFFDSTLGQVSNLLKVGTMQIVLAMVEAERVNLDLLLDDPLRALGLWSHDPDFEATAELLSGSTVTAIDLQERFLEEARAFESTGELEGVVPRAGEILELWEDTLAKLRARDLPALARRLDWVLKKSILERAIEQRPRLSWGAPETKRLDLAFSSLDAKEGLFWRYAPEFSERVVSQDEIERFLTEPPADTRAWTRAMLLRAAGPDRVEEVDWDRIRFRSEDGHAAHDRTLELSDPLDFGREQTRFALENRADLDDILDSLEAYADDGVSKERSENHGAA